jgi:flagellin
LVSGTGSNQDSFVITVNQGNLASVGAYSAAFTVTPGTSYVFQTGPNQGNGNTLQAAFGTFNSATLGLNTINVTSQSAAQYAITQAQSALSMLTNAQSAVGSQIDQINYTLTNLQTESTNLQASRSSIMDANMATVTSQFAQTQILEQTGIQALQTAQQLPSMVLKLLS